MIRLFFLLIISLIFLGCNMDQGAQRNFIISSHENDFPDPIQQKDNNKID